jgi:hypothetical protein
MQGALTDADAAWKSCFACATPTTPDWLAAAVAAETSNVPLAREMVRDPLSESSVFAALHAVTEQPRLVGAPAIVFSKYLAGDGSEPAIAGLVRVAYAELLTKTGGPPYAERAEELLVPAVRRNAASVEPVSALVDVLKLRPDGQAAITRLCKNLLEGNRAVQARACALSVSDKAQRAALLLDAYARLPALTKRDVEELAAQASIINSSQSAIQRCFRGEWSPRPDGAIALGGRGDLAQLFERLAESVTPVPSRACFLEEGAAACLSDVMRGAECLAPQAPARYAEILAVTDPNAYDRFTRFLFREKAVAYRLLEANPTSRQMQRVLLSLHLTLAHLYAGDVPHGLEPWTHPEYHLERAKSLYFGLYQETLPQAFFPRRS